MDAALFERLLNEEEGTTLDFKKEQYPFSKATDEEKSEVLKDILAFANAWRRADAYILIGVEDVRGGRSNVVGITDHLDDHSLQQFVTYKTNRPLHFSYEAFPFDGKQVGIIKIDDRQARPFHLKADYGKLKKNVVYIRRGSSTDEASPDEIARMGTSGEARRLQESAAANRGERFNILQSEFATRVKEGKFHDFAAIPATLLTVQTSLETSLEYDDLFKRVSATGKNLGPGVDAVSWAYECRSVELGTNGVLLHAYGGDYEAFRAKFPRTPRGREQARQREEAERESEPELWSVTYRGSRSSYHSNAGPAPQLLPVTELQMMLVSHAFDKCRLLATLQFPFPWLVGVSLVGANGFRLLAYHNESPKTIEADELHLGHCTIESLEQVPDRAALAGLLRGPLDRLFRTVGWERSDCFTSAGVWNQRFLD